MRINKVKLNKALTIIDMTPKTIIAWIRNNAKEGFGFLCHNTKYWNNAAIVFDTEEYYPHEIVVPCFVTFSNTDLKQSGYGDCDDNINDDMNAATFSVILFRNKKLRNQFFDVLKSLEK